MLGLLLGIVIPGDLRAASDADKSAKLIGHWTCSTEAGSTTSKTIAGGSNGSLHVTNVVTMPNGQTATIRETYVRTAPGGWKLTTVPDPKFPFGAYAATASAWTGPQWTFDGFESIVDDNGMRRLTEVRLVYSDLFPAGFRREHRIRSSGTWHDVSEEVCRRSARST